MICNCCCSMICLLVLCRVEYEYLGSFPFSSHGTEDRLRERERYRGTRINRGGQGYVFDF
uniref:Uncharacterized protein n=1 Tax=Rhizophora mucronata TaxID=61149 RepID=A0A2P2PD87_RHIMU